MRDFRTYVLVVVLFCFVLPGSSVSIRFHGDQFPKDQYEHFQWRDALKQAEKEFENRDWKLSEDERIADQYLSYLKWREFKVTRDLGFPPSKPIEKVLDRIVGSELYQVLAGLPKGGILHSHEDHQLSRKTLFDIVWNSEDFDDLYIIPPNAGKDEWTMDFFVNPPADRPWIKVKESGLTKEEILGKNTLIGLLTPEASASPTDSSLRWKLINPLWSRASVRLISNVNVKEGYIRAMLEHCYDEGVTYLETRRSFGLDLPLYSLDRSGRSNSTNGKRFFDSSYEHEINLTSSLVEQFARERPRFIGHKWISYAVRSANRDSFRSVSETTARLHEKYPLKIIGFDNVGQEDVGRSTLYFLDEYLSMYRNGKPRVPLYLHSVETSWPEDLMTGEIEDDLVSTLENSYETIILQSRRVGHGKGFVKKPFLRRILRDSKIAVEVCIVSNQILGMDADVRNHYGQILYKEGVPIVLGPDDPGTFGYDNTTVDWYSAYLSWGLNLGDLRQIALNSLVYSGMTDEEKREAIEKKWLPSWNDYAARLRCLACRRDFGRESRLEGRCASYKRAMPDRGSEGTRIHVFGSNFESAICKVPRCKFGGKFKVEAEYLSVGHLTCVAPMCEGCPANSTFPVYVSLDGGPFQPTGFSFTYVKGIDRNRHQTFK